MSLAVSPSFFENVSSDTKLLKLVKDIRRDEFTVSPTKALVSSLVDYIIKNINVDNLAMCPFAKLWTPEEFTDFQIATDYHVKKLMLTKNVKKILEKQTYDKKVDATLADYIKRLNCHVIGGVLGGFKVMNTIHIEEQTCSDIHYIRSRKHENILEYVLSRLSLHPGGGIVSCLENDHGCAFMKDTYDVSWSNNTYILNQEHNPHSVVNGGNMTFNICFKSLNGDIHKDNQAKGIYYTSNFEITERSRDEIIEQMKLTGSTRFGDFQLYEDRFAVLHIKNVHDTQPKRVFGDGIDFVLLHMKSVGTKKDILTKNSKEYEFIREVNNAYQSKNILSGGDINAPLWGRDGGYLKLTDADMMDYPFKELPTHDDPKFPFYGLPLLSMYDDDAVATKERVPTLENTQAILGKYGARKYHTDLLYGNVEGVVVEESGVYPDLRGVALENDDCRKSIDEQVTIPLIDKKHFWGSDHQVMQHTMAGVRSESVEDVDRIVFDIYNTLSECCSTDQHFDLDTGAERKEALKDYAVLLSNMITHIDFSKSAAKKIEVYESEKVIDEERGSFQSPLPRTETSAEPEILPLTDEKEQTTQNIIDELPTKGEVIVEMIRFVSIYYREIFIVMMCTYFLRWCL